jgi:hypothetical protein
MMQKEKIYRNNEWINVSDESCHAYGCNKPAVGTHYQGPGSARLGKGRGVKASDITILPLCQEHHDERDNKTVKKGSDQATLLDWEYLIMTFIFINQRLTSGAWELKRKK